MSLSYLDKVKLKRRGMTQSCTFGPHRICFGVPNYKIDLWNVWNLNVGATYLPTWSFAAWIYGPRPPSGIDWPPKEYPAHTAIIGCMSISSMNWRYSKSPKPLGMMSRILGHKRGVFNAYSVLMYPQSPERPGRSVKGPIVLFQIHLWAGVCPYMCVLTRLLDRS